MIKAEYKDTKKDMYVEFNGDTTVILNEYSAITENLFQCLARISGENEVKKALKQAYKNGLKRATEKEGKDNE